MTRLIRVTDSWLRTGGVVFVVTILVSSLLAPAATAATTRPDVTFVESTITTETTWTPADGPYRIVQDLEIAPGATLTVKPGTRIELAENITVTVDGSLHTNGTAASPVTITRADGATADRRWSGLEYTGREGSSLRLQNTTLEGGHSGVSVASSDGTIEIVDSTFRDFTRAGLAVTETTAAPPIAIRRSTFHDIGDHAIQASPTAGTTDRVSLTTPNGAGADAVHTLALQPGVGVSLDTIHLEHDSDGSVAAVSADSIERIGLDRNRNGSVDRSFADSVAEVSATRSRLRISLSKSVSIPSDGQLIVEYEDAVNPTTRGTYPVTVDLQKEGVSQIAAGVEAPFAVGDVTPPREIDSVPERPPTTQVNGLTVVGSAFHAIDGAGVFVAADRVGRLEASRNRINEVEGSGIAVRAKSTESSFTHNKITAGNNGIQVTTRETTSITGYGNRIRDSQSGFQIRQSGGEVYQYGDITLRENALTNNTGHGIDITTRGLELAVDVSNNTIRNNTRDGVHVTGWQLRQGQITDNTLADNGDNGIELAGTLLTTTTISGNRIVANADSGVSIHTEVATRTLTASNNTIKNSGGHGFSVQSELIIYGSAVHDNQLTNNAGAGLIVETPITQRGDLSVAHNVIAANTYGLVLRGVMGTTVRGNAIVFNTNRFADPVELPAVQPGTGSYVAEGEGGVIVSQERSDIPLSDLISDPAINDQLRAVTLWDDTVVLRTDKSSETRPAEQSELTIQGVSGDVPTGISLSETGAANSSYRFTNNGIYGQRRGLTVDIGQVIEANTTARIITESSSAVKAESNYWGSRHGPYHSSILPAGDGNEVVTKQGWVDFIPFRATPPEPEYTRPTATIDAPTNPLPGEEVQLSANGSTNGQGQIVRYRFSRDEGALSAGPQPAYTFEMPAQRVDVTLVVEDSLGIESNATATTIEPGTATATPRTETSTRTATPVATSPATPSDGPTLLGSLWSAWGLLGGVCYLIALLAGGYGMVRTVTDRSVPVEGVHIQALATLGILIWGGAGLLGRSPLLTVGIVATLVWGSLTGIAYLIAVRR